jgi:hypothetical protein
MLGESGRDWSLPLLPVGTALFDELPFGALVLEALAPAVGNGLITVRDDGCEGILVIRDGVVSESVWVGDDARSTGDAATALIHTAHTATVSACRLSEDAMALVGPLLSGTPRYADLRLEWVVWAQLLSDLRDRGATYVVEVTTESGRGVTVIRDGRQIATFAESHPALGDASLLDELAAGGTGTIRVLVAESEQAASEPLVLPVATSTVGEQSRQPVAPVDAAPSIVTQTDDPNATLSALFGPHRDDVPVSGPSGGGVSSHVPSGTPVAALLPELMLLVQHRLQRSSQSVEDIVESAANDRQTVSWLAERVRVVTMRGFLHATFEQLADDMLALAGRATD